MLVKSFRQSDWALLLVALLGISASLLAFYQVRQWEHEQILNAHHKQADNQVRTLSQTFGIFDTLLHSTRGLHNVVENSLSRREFESFFRPELFNPYSAEYLGLQGWEWIPYVPNQQRLQLEQHVRGQDFVDFRIWQHDATGLPEAAPTDKTAYYPILYTEPKVHNVLRLGFDLAADPTLLAALESARDSAQITASGQIPIYTNYGTKQGFRLLMPIYRADNPSEPLYDNVAMRRQHLEGYTAAVFVYDELIKRTLRIPRQRTEIFIQIYDATAGNTDHLIYAPPWLKDIQGLHPAPIKLWEFPLEVGGRYWRLVYSTLPDGLLFQTRYAWMVLGLGVLFTLGLLGYIYIILTRARWAEALVYKRTQSLSEANRALDASRRRFQAIFDEAAIGIAQISLAGKIIASNKALQNLLKYDEEELRGNFLKSFTHPEDTYVDQHMLADLAVGHYNTCITGKRYICKNGAVIWTNQSCSIVRDTHSPFIISMIEDVTERKYAEQARLEAEKKYRDIYENAIEGIFQSLPSGQYLSVNPAFVRMLGFHSEQQIYQEITDIGQQIYTDIENYREFLCQLDKKSKVQGFEHQVQCRDGRVIWVSETARTVRDLNGNISYYEGIIEDISERKHTEAKLRYDASHDQLTGLYNRVAFTKRLNQLLNALPLLDAQAIPFAVLFVDLDRFKIVNDSMGHWVGDQLLKEIAQRINNTVAEAGMVARFGGDEFAILLDHIQGLTDLEKQIKAIQTSLAASYTLQGEAFNTSASIGIALGNLKNPCYKNADEILRDADTAMYEAKKCGRGKYVIFQPGMHTHVVNMLRLETDLRKAFERGEFRLYYQPIISVEKNHTVGLEALIRWQHPERGLLSPDKFIPLAEETGLIADIGLWVFETACQQLSYWQQQFPQHSRLGMNINVSPVQLRQPRLVREVQDILERTGVSGLNCRMEITESAMMHDPEGALHTLNELKNLEVQLYVDDFGTGYSSLSYLQKFPLDALKIDKGFIREIDSSNKSAQIAQAIIALGKAFDLRVVAEGVENESQMTILKASNCHHVQGYFFSRPIDSTATEQYLSHGA